MMSKGTGLTVSKAKELHGYVDQGLSATEIADNMGVSRKTVYRWLEETSLKIRKKKGGITKPETETPDPEPPEDGDVEGQIREKTQNKHVNGITTALSKLTIDREMMMRQVAAVMEKHEVAIDNIHTMTGLDPDEIVSMAIVKLEQITKEIYFEKVKQAQENAVRAAIARTLRGQDYDGEERGSERENISIAQ